MSVQNVGYGAKSGFGDDLSNSVEPSDTETETTDDAPVSDNGDGGDESEPAENAGDEQPGEGEPEQPETEGDNPDH